MNECLRIVNANYGYQASFHLNKLNFQIDAGKITGVIGPNGSGKSTFLKGISGEIQIEHDQVFLFGEDLSQLSMSGRAQKIATVSQFIEELDISVEEYVLLGRIPYRKPFQLFENKRDMAIARKFLKLTNTYHLRSKNFSRLSGGEQQLVSIARALTQEPELLLLDEPTSHLDISHQVEVLDLIQELSDQLKLTVIIIIHDLNLASEYCDELVLLHEGSLYQKGTPQEILNYSNIENVYNTLVITQENPLSKKPTIFLVTKKVLNDSKKQS
jgi:iron complex transport system ATP-binding protein